MAVTRDQGPVDVFSDHRLYVEVCGRFAVHYRDVDVPILNRKSQALLACLALTENAEKSREQLIDLLWSGSDRERGRGSLRQALYEITKSFRAVGFSHFHTNKLTASIDHDFLHVDVFDVIEEAKRGEVHSLLRFHVRIIDTLLAEFELVDPVFASWLRGKRQSLQNEAIFHLETAWRAIKPEDDRQNYELLARALIRLDPAHEEAARGLIQSRVDAGDIGTAFNIYADLWAHLEREYDAQPSTETQELIAEIRQSQPLDSEDPLKISAAVHADLDVPIANDGRPSIAVLPFRHHGPPSENYFGDGVVDNIIQALAALKDLVVIERGSTLDFRDTDLDFRRIGRDLRVRYVLHGSVQRGAGNRIRVSTELVDTANNEVIRTGRHAGTIDELFELQDEIAIDTAKSIVPNIRQRELSRALKKHPTSMTAYDLVIQALEPLYDLDYATFARAEGLLMHAIDIDPTYATAYSYAARWHSLRVGQEWSPDVAGDVREAIRLSTEAIKLDETDPLALTIYGYQQAYLRKDFNIGLETLDRALGLCPNMGLAWSYSAALLCYQSRGEEAVERARKGLRLSPVGRHAFFAEHILAQAHYIVGEYDDAAHWARLACQHNPHLTSNLRTLASSLVAAGRLEEARKVAQTHQQIVPKFRTVDWASRTPMNANVARQRVSELHAAGFPD